MSIDFNALVLAPAQDIFGIDVKVILAQSRPGDAPYYGTGIFSSRSLPILLQDGTTFSDQQTTIDLKVDEWLYLPARGDRIEVISSHIAYWVADQSFDGQGGVQLQLRRTEPEE